MAQLIVPNVPSTATVEDLRAALIQALTNLVNQINSGDGAQLNAANQRLINVGMCASLYDGVPKIYVDNKIEELSLDGTGAGGQYTIVFANDSPSDAYLSSPFAVGRDRQGQIEDVWLTVDNAPSSTCAINFIVNGTHTLLATDISLGSGNKGPTHSANFNTPVPPFVFNTTVQMQITTTGGATLLTGGLVIRRV